MYMWHTFLVWGSTPCQGVKICLFISLLFWLHHLILVETPNRLRVKNLAEFVYAIYAKFYLNKYDIFSQIACIKNTILLDSIYILY